VEPVLVVHVPAEAAERGLWPEQPPQHGDRRWPGRRAACARGPAQRPAANGLARRRWRRWTPCRGRRGPRLQPRRQQPARRGRPGDRFRYDATGDNAASVARGQASGAGADVHVADRQPVPAPGVTASRAVMRAVIVGAGSPCGRSSRSRSGTSAARTPPRPATRATLPACGSWSCAAPQARRIPSPEASRYRWRGRNPIPVGRPCHRRRGRNSLRHVVACHAGPVMPRSHRPA